MLHIIGLFVLSAVIIVLLIVLLYKTQETRKHMATMVKRRTRELEIQKNAAQTAYKVKSRFLANMSHEIRTPLNAIIGLSQTELERAGPDSKASLSAINHSGNVLLGLINDLIDISNIESGDMQLKLEDYSLPLFINNAAASAKLGIGIKNIELQIELDEDLPVKLHGDKQRINQILGNLLSNAVKFTNEGTVVLRTSFSTLVKEDELLLIFEVYDTGIGIRSEDMENLFTGYNQPDIGSSKSVDSGGMGLLITKKLVELMGGDVKVVSEYGKGSSFTVWIPQQIADKTVLGKETVEKLKSFTWKEIQEKRLYLPYVHALTVDDVPTNHAVAKGFMKPYGMNIDSVLSGQEAVDLISNAEVKYDIIFMDHMMPGMDGVEATKLIRGLGTDYSASIPIVALTANATPGIEEMFLSNGFNAFMAKPINANVLNNVLRQWVWDEEKDQLFSEEIPEEIEIKSSRFSAYTIDGVDLEAGSAQFGGEENYLEIVKVFINDTPKLLIDVQKFLDTYNDLSAGDTADASGTAILGGTAIKNYTITVHGIKGSCYGICAQKAGDLAKELEMAAKANDIAKITELNNPFIKNTLELVEKLTILFPAKNDISKPSKDAPDSAILQKLLDSAKAFNFNAMTEFMDELDQYEYLENNELILQLRQAVDNYEYTEAIELLSTVLLHDSETKL